MGSLEFTIHSIAPYHSNGIEKAGELTFGWNAQASSNSKCQKEADRSNGKVVFISLSCEELWWVGVMLFKSWVAE